MVKNASAIYYQKTKERLQKKACKRYQNPSEEKETKRLVDYRIDYLKTQKNTFFSMYMKE